MTECPRILQRAPNLVGADSGGETILVDLQTGSFFGLGSTGATVWRYLANPCTAVEIASRLGAIFGVPGEQIRPDIDVFLASLAAAGLVVDAREPFAAIGEGTDLEKAEPPGAYLPPRLDRGTLRDAANGFQTGSDGLGTFTAVS